MDWLQWWELGSYVVTVVGLPFAIAVFWMEQRRERQNDEEETYQRLSDEYAEFLKLVLQNSDLGLFRGLASEEHEKSFNAEQLERKRVLLEILISLFERAYLLVYEEELSRQNQRLWASWEDYMREWCRRPDFRRALPSLLQGEDPDFCAHIRRIAEEEEARTP
jgi:hypothetical protein